LALQASLIGDIPGGSEDASDFSIGILENSGVE
jgi:hypothetical protein